MTIAGRSDGTPDVGLPEFLVRAAAGDAVTDPIELAQLLDVDVEEFARGGAFIAPDRLGWLQGRQSVEPKPPENAAHRGRRPPTSAAICSPVWRRLRKTSTAAQTAGVAWLGEKSGLNERARKPFTPRLRTARPTWRRASTSC